MTKKTAIGIRRGQKFSPNQIDADSILLQGVAERLSLLGYEVNLFSEEEFCIQRPCGNLFFSMGRNKQTLDLLNEIEKKGGLVINPTVGVKRCVRKEMTEFMMQICTPMPESVIISTQDPIADLPLPCWIKRADSHTKAKDDVVYVSSAEEAETCVRKMRRRDISEVVACKHLHGDLIKFYGVSDTPFFRWYYADSLPTSKFGLESVNGATMGYPIQEEKLEMLCYKMAQDFQVPIFGGDCIVEPDGTIRVIDFNDWPSFAVCREEAVQHIASFIHQQANTK